MLLFLAKKKKKNTRQSLFYFSYENFDMAIQLMKKVKKKKKIK